MKIKSISVFVACTTLSISSYANDSLDIGGVKLKMSPEEAIAIATDGKKYFHKANERRTAYSYENPLENKGPKSYLSFIEVHNGPKNSLMIQSEPTGEQIMGQAEKWSFTFATPNGGNILLGVEREISKMKNPPTTDQLLSSLRQKYGEPLSEKYGYHIWGTQSIRECISKADAKELKNYIMASERDFVAGIQSLRAQRVPVEKCGPMVITFVKNLPLQSWITITMGDIASRIVALEATIAQMRKEREDAMKQKQSQGVVPKL